MYKKSFALLAVFCAAFFSACQDNPTRIHSTQQVHSNQPSEIHSTNTNGSVHPKSHDAMTHSTMQSAPNAAAQPYDLQFLDTMIAHHEGAIEMAKLVEAKSQNADLKTFAAKIAADQQQEIAQMKSWREQWFAGKPSAMNMEMTGMTESMRGMNMSALNSATGTVFDLEFIKQMIPHHEGAAVMSREALSKAEHPELKNFANQIIREQEAEIKQMQNWQTAWTK